ncbi:MAG: PadR family transcriptional regulator [Chloroflexi bacterium]|nr:PadR family transcriptional regulator [Chloroflexota bacterium]
MESNRDLLPGEYAVLGLLAVEPGHGYEVNRRWQESPLADLLPVEQSVLYGYLRTLERRGLLDWEEHRIGNRPPRKVFELSEEGWEYLRPWLRSPVERMREVRLDLLLKLFLLEEIDPGGVSRLIADQVVVCLHYVEHAAARLDEAEGFTRLIAESRLSAGRSTLDWLSSHLPHDPARGRVAS